MGCGKSKHAVATTDTTSQSKRSNSTKQKSVESAVDKATNNVKTEKIEFVESQENGISSGERKDSKVVKDTENADKVPEDGNVKERVKESVGVKESVEAKEEKAEDVKGNEGVKEEPGVAKLEEKAKAKEDKVEEVKDNDQEKGTAEVGKAKESKENVETEKLQVEDEKIADKNAKESDQVKQGDAPVQEEESHNFLSPGKSGETIESMIPDGLSGKSEYHSPHAMEVEELKNANDAAAEEKGSSQEIKIEAKNDKEEVTSQNEVNKAETALAAEGKDTANSKEEKASLAKEEIIFEASTEDSKKN